MNNESLLRKASDLLWNASGSYLNVNPRVPVKVGSFGRIDRATAAFIQLGNVYDSDMVREVIPDIDSYPPAQGAISTIEAIRSQQALAWSFETNPQVSLEGLLDGSVDLKLTVTPGKRAAFLIMGDVRTDYLPTDKLGSKLAMVKGLAGMVVVTQVVVCSSYLFGVTQKAEKKLSGKAETSVPIGVGAFTVGGGAGVDLSMSQAAELLSRGEPQAGDSQNSRFATLLRFQVMKPAWVWTLTRILPVGFRGPVPVDDPTVNDSNAWMDMEAPWDPLNDDECAEEAPSDDLGSDEDW